ncbi:MAG: DUF4142 domain-containing protein [Pedobacter sp.]|uniref:DUF4142 domain-containing protein n=1 Tax=Pedobacter sp. TaxID=1411316 RepID=UPI002806C822|nr:DUF4142 domain-containing protein [Pedobacter sp.]MDQ8003583.1 DUF4142 domain-containing protein [Pedobacter sp.]
MIKLNKIMVLGSTAAIMLAASCTNSSEREHRDTAAEEVDSNIDVTTKAQVNTADINMDGGEKAFIISAYSQSLYTIELATAAAKSKDEALRNFAKKITPGYQKMLTDIESIAKGKGLTLERNVSEAQRKELDAIKQLGSPTLDQQVLQKMQMLQASFTTLFKEAAHLQSDVIKDFAKNSMSPIHSQQAETTTLFNKANETGSQSTRPGEVATQ